MTTLVHVMHKLKEADVMQSDYNERQQSQQHKHKFKSSKRDVNTVSKPEASRPRKKAMLSFADGNDDDGEGDD